MKSFFSNFIYFFSSKSPTHQSQSQEVQNFFDYSSSHRVKIMRAAGREAQKEQTKLLREYDARFGQA